MQAFFLVRHQSRVVTGHACGQAALVPTYLLEICLPADPDGLQQMLRATFVIRTSRLDVVSMGRELMRVLTPQLFTQVLKGVGGHSASHWALD